MPAEQLTGRQIMMAALRQYRANPNRVDGEKVINGCERLLKEFERVEDELADSVTKREEWEHKTEEEIQEAVDLDRAWVIWAVLEEHEGYHDGAFAVCPHNCCRAAEPLIEAAAASIAAVHPSYLFVRQSPIFRSTP